MGAQEFLSSRDTSLSARSDFALVEACRQGDRTSWDELVSRYERLVFTVALRNGLSREDSADVTQSTLLALLDSIDSIRNQDRLASWLMTVARRQAWRLRERAARETPLAEILQDQADPIVEWERSQAVLAAVAQLPEPCRELVRALFLDPEQPTYEQISQQIGRPVGSLGPMRARCLAQLRRLMEEGAG